MLKCSWSIRIPLFSLIVIPLVSLTIESQAATWYVRPAGGGAGTAWGDALASFQAAIHSATAGDEIWGASGVYNESLTLKAGIALYGGFAATETVREDRDFVSNPTILDATGLNQRVITADETNDVTIDGFTIRNGRTASSGGGIFFRRVSSATVSNCTISGNRARSGGGVYCVRSSPTVTYCTISSNAADKDGGGVDCRESSSPRLTDCTISGNTASDGGGMQCGSSSPTLSHCTISGNAASGNGGGVLYASSSPTLAHCTISGNTASSNGGGVYCSGSSPTLTHCTITGNTANTANEDGGGVYSSYSSPTLTNCILWNPGIEIFVVWGVPEVRYSCVQGGYPGEGNIDGYPLFVHPLNGDWRLRDGSPCIDRGTDVGLPFNGASPDMGAWEAPASYSQGLPNPVPHLFHVDADASKGGDGLTWETAFTSVGEALLHSSTADQIWVASGTYNESIHLEMGTAVYGGFAATETVREDRDFVSNPTILDATGLNRRVITADGTDGVTIDGFTIRNGDTTASGGGIYFNNVSSATVSNCRISDNTASFNGGGVYFLSSSPTLTNCTTSGNEASSGGGMYFSSSSPALINCTISDNRASFNNQGVYCLDSSPTLTNCILWNPGIEIFVVSGAPLVRYSCVQGGYSGEGNIDAYPQFVDPLNGDWRLRNGSPCIDRGADIGLPFNGAGPDMGSREAPETYSQGPPDHVPQLFHVYAGASKGGDGLTWETAFPSIREALFFSSKSDEIWVAAGTYYESIRLELGSALYGGFTGTETVRENRDIASNPTILDATGLSRRVLTADGTNGVTIDGFTIRYGNTTASGGGIFFNSVSSATVSNCTITGNTARYGGGGVYCSNSSPTLTNCTISGNSAGGDGGGVYCIRSSPTLTNCTITGNTARYYCGGVYCSNSSPTLTNCTITGNTARWSGGGVYCSNSSPTLTLCTISDNTASFGAGVDCSSSSLTMTHCTISGNTARSGDGGGMFFSLSSPTLTNCTISDNTADRDGGGLACSSSSSPTLTNCTISDNTADRDGGGVYCLYSSPALSHCTITGNTAYTGGGVYCTSSSPTLTNCILWNPGNEIRVESGTPVVGHSCVQGGYPGEVNIEAYPQFVDPLNGDWRLRDGSPCIDRGTEVGLPFNGEAPDMGSWEAPETYLQGSPESVPQLFHVDSGASRGGNGLSWETAFSSVGEALLHSSTAVEIWVAAGTYNESIHTEMGSAFYGGFTATETVRENRDFASNPTILDATGLSRRVLTADGTNGVTIDGFTIRYGNTTASGGGIFFNSVSSATVSNCTITGNTARYDGGGVYCSNSSPTLTNCTISDNTATGSGGGVYCDSSSPTLTDCTISGNTATGFRSGGGVYCFNSSPILTHCTFSGNSATEYGGGVFCSFSSLTMTHCTISGNTASGYGGGVYCGSSSPTLTDCTISGNTADYNGGGIYCLDRSSPTLTNCTITGNTAIVHGGGVYCSSNSSPTLTHCTIAGNTASRGTGVASLNTSSPTLINSILWNGGDEVFLESATAEVTFSAVQGGYPGQGNIDEDPMFVDPEQSDYQLSMGSPCIDSGSNGAVLRLGPSALALGDHLGRMRIWDGDADGIAVVDMGAYEFGPPPFVGDISGDSRVNHLDLFRFQQVWKQEGEGALPEADQDGDRTIGPTDLTILLHVWGNMTGP